MSEKMIFCLGDGQYELKGEGYQKNLRVFNKDVSQAEYEETLSVLTKAEIKISLTRWVEEKDMTDDDKENYSTYKLLGGCLKVVSYEEAWATFWKNATSEQRNTITGLKWFDKDIFKAITGVDVTTTETIEIGGQKYSKDEVEKRLKDLQPIN